MTLARADKILVLGLDGMDPKFTTRMLKEEKMPNLKKFMENGGYREDLVMLGAHPTVTPPMWTTMATGAYPCTHGITDFHMQSTTDLDRLEYAFDSKACQAEQLWNVFAEAGKKTLVWHWPGSSWPPTSDSPNLYVVDGTQPAVVNGSASVDTEFVFQADVKTKEVTYLPRASSDSHIPCVIENLDFETPTLMDQSRNIILSPDEGTGSVSMSPFDVQISPIKLAEGWVEAPAEAKEFTILFSKGLVRHVGLILKSESGVYDHVAFYKNKQAEVPYVTLEKNVFTQDVICDVLKGDTLIQANRNMRLLEITPDGDHIKLWISAAMDFSVDAMFSPKSLFKTVLENVGYPQPFSFMGGSNAVLIRDCTGANWMANAKWTANSLNYLIKHEAFDVIFSHYHCIDLQGHMIVKYLKAKNMEGQKLSETEYFELFQFVYEQVDAYVGEFLGLLDEGWTIILLSDHGQVCPEHLPPALGDATGVNVRLMEELGYTTLKYDENHNELHEIDWSKTKAVANRASHIYLNLKGRDKYGIVDPKDQYELEEEIITALYGYHDKTTGKRVVSLALRNKDAIILGLSGPTSGDIVYCLAEGYNFDHGDCLSTTEGYADTSVSPIFIATGKGIKKGITKRIIRQVDVAPTIAVLGGVRMPAQCEGAPLYQLLDGTMY